jgi:SRSO17 transposase
MDVQELKGLRRKLGAFARQFDDCIKTRPSRKHMRTYLNGQLGSLKRKSIEPIALEAGVPVRTLQEFLSIHRWDDDTVARRLREIVMRDHADSNAIGVIDETSFVKKGVKTAGVQRQYCGHTGKVENCVVTVHLGYVTADFHALIDGDLYLPEESWSKDRNRCREARIPEDVVYRPKWRIALDLLERSRQDGVQLRWITADEAYGRSREFRDTVSEWGINYVVEIPSNLFGWSRMPRIEPEGTISASGRRSQKPRLAAGEKPARAVSQLWKRGGPSWQTYRVKDTQKGPEVWHIRETRFYPHDGGLPGRESRLIIAEHALSGEVKYFLSDAGPEVPLKTLLYVAFSRWHIERLFEDGKGEVGFDDFEVRSYRSLIRHLVLTNLSLYFLCEQTTRLRGGKSLVDTLPGEEGGRGTARSGHHAEGAYTTIRKSGHKDPLPATTDGQSRLLPRQAEAARPARCRHRSTKSATMSCTNLALPY